MDIEKGKCCENCYHAIQTDIDGLIYCEHDGHFKDDDMVCDKFETDMF